MTPKKPSDDNQPDLFGNGGTAVVEKDEKPAAKSPVKAQSGG